MNSTGGRLPELPTLDHRGRRYQRQRGKWLDRGLSVELTLSQQLDAKAKEDPDFWDKCEAQDFKDDPRNRGKFRLDRKELAELFPESDEGELQPLPVAPRPVRGYQSSSRHRRKRDQDHLDASFKRDGELVLRCDINGGWRPTERGWYFHASAPVHLKGDHVLSAFATVAEDTSGHWNRRHSSDVESCREATEDDRTIDSIHPYFGYLEKTQGPIRCTVDGPACTFFVRLLDSHRELNGDLPWNHDGSHWNFGFVDYGIYELPIRLPDHSMCQSRPFRIELRCVLRQPPRSKLQPEYEYDTPLPSAGLPSLGKRR